MVKTTALSQRRRCGSPHAALYREPFVVSSECACHALTRARTAAACVPLHLPLHLHAQPVCTAAECTADTIKKIVMEDSCELTLAQVSRATDGNAHICVRAPYLKLRCLFSLIH
jgi:hypothetical protein